MRQRSRKEDTTATKTRWAIRRGSRSRAKPGAGGRSGVVLFLKKNKGKKMKIAIILLLWMAEAASSPKRVWWFLGLLTIPVNSVFSSGIEKEMGEAGLGWERSFI